MPAPVEQEKRIRLWDKVSSTFLLSEMSTGDNICQIPGGELGSQEYCSAVVESKERLKDGVRGMKGWLEKWPISIYNAVPPPSTGQVSAFPSRPFRHCPFSLPVSILMPLHVPAGPSGADADPRWQTNPSGKGTRNLGF